MSTEGLFSLSQKQTRSNIFRRQEIYVMSLLPLSTFSLFLQFTVVWLVLLGQLLYHKHFCNYSNWIKIKTYFVSRENMHIIGNSKLLKQVIFKRKSIHQVAFTTLILILVSELSGKCFCKILSRTNDSNFPFFIYITKFHKIFTIKTQVHALLQFSAYLSNCCCVNIYYSCMSQHPQF